MLIALYRNAWNQCLMSTLWYHDIQCSCWTHVLRLTPSYFHHWSAMIESMRTELHVLESLLEHDIAAGAMISSITVAPAVVAVAKKSAERPVARKLRDGAEQLYVTRGNHLLATQAGMTIGEAIAEVRGPLNTLAC